MAGGSTPRAAGSTQGVAGSTLLVAGSTLLVALLSAGAAAEKPPEEGYVSALLRRPTAASIRGFHDLLASEPHVAGSPGDAREIERLNEAFKAMGLESRIEPFWAMLPVPVDAKLEIVGESGDAAAAGAAGAAGASAGASATGADPPRRGVVPLTVVEGNLLEDPATAHPDLTYGWNAFSGSGDVTAPIVYANYGTKADFAKLRELGIDCHGKIVLARYGGNFRGYKAKFAEEAGAAGLLIYTDPADSGVNKGAVWPKGGGWANDLCIQRGSLLTLDWPGDPLTPFRPATKDAERLDPQMIALPRIPVQPIGYAAASQIISRMKGAALPDDLSAWKGGLPLDYRIEGGPDLRVHLLVKQDRPIRESANVIAVLPGASAPRECVILGCHHDAWGFGAADPLAGTIVLMEAAKAFAEEANAGRRPARTVIFAAWGAEEFGIIGSVEWVEGHREEIASGTVAYMNLDMASMGPKFGAGAASTLRPLIFKAAGLVPQAGAEAGRTVATQMTDDGKKEAEFGDLGGGSDHIGFNCHLAIPCLSIGGHGSQGSSYHSNFDTLAWYRHTVGDDYQPALMITRMALAIAAPLADDPILPLRTARIGQDLVRQAKALAQKAPDAPTRVAIESLAIRGEAIAEAGSQVDAALDHFAALDEEHRSQVAASKREEINRLLMALDRAWFDPKGLVGRPWFKNLSIASDRDSGYASVTLPLITEALESGDAASVLEATDRTADAIDRVSQIVQDLQSELGHPGG